MCSHYTARWTAVIGTCFCDRWGNGWNRDSTEEIAQMEMTRAQGAIGMVREDARGILTVARTGFLLSHQTWDNRGCPGVGRPGGADVILCSAFLGLRAPESLPAPFWRISEAGLFQLCVAGPIGGLKLRNLSSDPVDAYKI